MVVGLVVVASVGEVVEMCWKEREGISGGATLCGEMYAGSHHRTKAGGAKLSIFLETRRGYEYESRCDVAKRVMLPNHSPGATWVGSGGCGFGFAKRDHPIIVPF